MTNYSFRVLSRTIVGVAAAALLVATPAAAQLANASASTLALAGNNTASVRGFAAISVNPAGLGMPGSGFSLALAPIQVRLGLEPIKWGDFVDFEGMLIPTATKEDWLTRIAEVGSERGAVGADASVFALTVGNLGFQLSAIATGDINVPPGFAEAVLFGNAGRTGTAADLSLVGATLESFAMTTAAMSFALPVNSSLVFGLTGKYTYGNGLAVGRSESGAFEADPIRATMEFPLISCAGEVDCTDDFFSGRGTGFALDIGAMVDLGGITLGASLQNVISNFAWDETKLAYRPGTLLIEDGEFDTQFDELPFDQAPEDLKAIVRDFTPKSSVRLGAALDLTPMLTLTGDIHGRLSDEGISLQPDYSTGVGAELRLGFLHLRGGLTKISEGMQYGGGASLVLGPVNLSGAMGLRKGEFSDTVITQVGLSFGNR